MYIIYKIINFETEVVTFQYCSTHIKSPKQYYILILKKTLNNQKSQQYIGKFILFTFEGDFINRTDLQNKVT